MMVVGVRHTGIVVPDLKLAISFYEAIGFQIASREVESGPVISTIVGILDAKIDVAKMKASDGSMIELLQYLSHPDFAELSRQPSNKLGCSHIALTVKSIAEICKVILEFGGALVNEPIHSVDGRVLVAYCHSPSGVLIEVVQQLHIS